MPIAWRRVFPLARQQISIIDGVVISGVIGSVPAVAARASKVSKCALPVLDETNCLQEYAFTLLFCFPVQRPLLLMDINVIFRQSVAVNLLLHCHD